MIRVLLAFIFGWLPMQAAALSCSSLSYQERFILNQASENTYKTVHGKLTFNKAALPFALWLYRLRLVDETIIPARLTGKSLSNGGFDQPFDQDVSIEVVCHWGACPRVQSGFDGLAFVKQSGNRYTLFAHVCGTAFSRNPSQSDLDWVLQCYQDGNCVPSTE